MRKFKIFVFQRIFTQPIHYQCGWEHQVEHVVEGLAPQQQHNLHHGEGLIAEVLHRAIRDLGINLIVREK